MASSSWQTGKINERMKYLLESGEDSDIEFLVRINNQSGEKKASYKYIWKAEKMAINWCFLIFLLYILMKFSPKNILLK
jgi:hypothetical protein